MDEIYTWGYGDILAAALNGISMLVAQAEYVTWLKLAVLISTVALILAWIRGRVSGEGGIAVEAGFRNPWYPLTYFLATWILFFIFVGGPQVTVTVVDRTTGQNHVVTNVPIGIAYPLSVFSNFELSMGEIVETVLGVPNNLRYSEVGLFAGIVALKSAVDFRVQDERLMGNLNNFSVDCVIPGILSGDIDRNNLLNGDFATELNNVNPALVTSYRDSSGNILVVDCQTALGNLLGDLSTYVNPVTGNAIPFLEKITGLGARFSTVLSESLNYFLGYTGSAQDFLMHNIFMNQFLIAETSWLQANGISASQVAVGTALAERQLASQGAVSGFLARNYMPVLKGIMTTMAVASVPVVVLLLMLGGFLYSRRVILTGMIMVLLWLSLWHIMEVILNMIVMEKTGSLLQNILGSGWSSMALYKQGLISSEVLRYASMAGQYYWLVPSFSLLVAGGFSIYTMNSLAHSGAGVASSAATSAAAQAATGSFKAGEIGMNNIRMNTFTSNVLTREIWSEGVVNLDNWTESTTHIGSSMGDLGIAGLKGYAGQITRLPDGSTVVHNAVGKDRFSMQNVLINNGAIKPAGASATISAPSGEVMKQNLMKINPNLVNDIEGMLESAGLEWKDVNMMEIKVGESGHVVAFKAKGADFSYVLHQNGNFGGRFSYAGIEGGMNEHGITNLGKIPISGKVSQKYQEIGEKKAFLSKEVQEFDEKTRGWSEVGRVMYSEILKAFAQGKLSAEDVEKAWESINAVENEYGVGLKGQAGTFRHGGIGNVPEQGKLPKPVEIFNKLPATVRNKLPFLASFGTFFRRRGEAQAGANFRGREGTTTKEGGRVGSGYTTGVDVDENRGYGKDLSEVTSENLRYLEKETKKLDEVFSRIQSEGIDLTRQLEPAIVNHYAKENELSIVEALRELSENNWEKLMKLEQKFWTDAGYRNDILKEMRKQAKEIEEETKDINVDTSKLKNQNIGERIKKEMEKEKQNIEKEADEKKADINRNIGNIYTEGMNTADQVIENLSDRKKLAGALGAVFTLSSLFGLAPNSLKVPGTTAGPKGLPPGPKTDPLPGGSGKPLPGKGSESLPPGKGPMEELGGINNPEQLKEYFKQRGIELTDEEAEKLLESRNRFWKTNDLMERQKIVSEFAEILEKAIIRNSETFTKIRKDVSETASNVEKAIYKQIAEQAGEQGARSILKKIPLLGIAVGAYFAYQRAQEGDTKGAILEFASGIASAIPVIGTGASLGIDTYLLARDLGIIDKNVSREEFNKIFNQVFSQAQMFSSINDLRANVWNNQNVRNQVLDQMRVDSSFSLNLQGKQVRLDEEGNIYDYTALAQRGLSVNTEGQIYDVSTGRILNNVNKNEFIVGRVA